MDPRLQRLQEEIAAAVEGLSAEQLKPHPAGAPSGVLARGPEQKLPHGLSGEGKEVVSETPPL